MNPVCYFNMEIIYFAQAYSFHFFNAALEIPW